MHALCLLPFARCISLTSLSLPLSAVYVSICVRQATGACIWAITTQYASLKEAYRHFGARVEGMDAYWYTVKELNHCLVHYSVSDFILSELDQPLIQRIAGLTGSQ